MKIEKEKEEQIINFGAFRYESKRIAIILDVDENVIISEMQNPKSELSILLEKGRYISEYVLDLKLFELAKTGDMKAMDLLEQRKQNRKIMK